jgi:hypothetical protein
VADDDYAAAAAKLAEAGKAMSHLDDGQILALGHEALGIIIARTRTGVDADGHPFKAYSEDYKKIRAAKGLNTVTVDLARTGHMIGGMTVSGRAGEAEIAFQATHEAKKAAAHNFGVNKQVSVRAHSRSSYVNKKGQRVTAKEAKLDAKRKTKRVYQRAEKVSSHKRKMNTPRREFFDVRLDAEWRALSESAGVQLQGNVEKVFAK